MLHSNMSKMQYGKFNWNSPQRNTVMPTSLYCFVNTLQELRILFIVGDLSCTRIDSFL